MKKYTALMFVVLVAMTALTTSQITPGDRKPLECQDIYIGNKLGYGLNLDRSINASDGLNYKTNPDGSLTIRDISSGLESQMIFGMTGNVGLTDTVKVVNDFSWTWNTTIIQNLNIQKINCVYNKTNNYTTIRTTNTTDYILSASNNDAKQTWTQTWTITPQHPTKIKNTIRNNQLTAIDDVKYWYGFNIPKRLPFKINNQITTLNTATPVLAGDNPNLIPPIVEMGGVINFDWTDLITSQFNVTDIILKNGSILGMEDTPMILIGVSKNTGLPSLGTVELDPSVTAWTNPASFGKPNNAWTNPSYLLASDNNRATASGLENVGNFTFSVPAGTTVAGIEIRIEARDGSIDCAA